MIVLNEKLYAEECLKKKIVSDKPFYTLSILAKYYYYCFGYKKKKIIELLIDFMEKAYPRYSCNKSMWDETIEKIATNVKKYTLYEIDGVWVTEAELQTIQEIHSKVLERLAFTLLCLAKLGNMKNPKNNGWVNNDDKEIFALARISCSVAERDERIGELHEMSLLEFPNRIDNLSVRVTYINDDSPKKLFISDFRELGYEYLKYKGENFIRCRECGILIRNNKSNTKKYCKQCSGYVPQDVKTVVCVDCGKEFEIPGSSKKVVRCAECQNKRNKENMSLSRQRQYYSDAIMQKANEEVIIYNLSYDARDYIKGGKYYKEISYDEIIEELRNLGEEIKLYMQDNASNIEAIIDYIYKIIPLCALYSTKEVNTMLKSIKKNFYEVASR